MRFRPTFWPTVFTIPVVLVLLGLGTWQLQRLQWKENLIAERVERTTAPPTALPREDNASAEKLADLQYRRVAVTGEYLHDRELYLAARSLRGNPGYHVMTPVRLAEPAFGVHYIMVDRGWVPIDRKLPESRPDGQLVGERTIEGIVRIPAGPNWFTPDNQPADNMWYWIDLPAMASHAGIAGDVAPIFLDATATDIPGTYPLGGQTRIQLPNDHLQYAITWYSLAVALIVIYIVYHRRKPEEEARP